uniref:Uncharacterized protein n=1 Tax=Solanum lycopersicum TaxID=4081 RepID=A0A3Q7GJ33_SOLLC
MLAFAISLQKVHLQDVKVLREKILVVQWAILFWAEC